MLIQFSMLALFASVARTSVELYASADDEKTTTVAKSASVSVSSTAFAAALAIPIRVPDIEPETSTTTTTSFGTRRRRRVPGTVAGRSRPGTTRAPATACRCRGAGMLRTQTRRATCSPPWRRCVGTTSRRSTRGTSPSCPARRRSRRRCAASSSRARRRDRTRSCTSPASRTRGPTAARSRRRLTFSISHDAAPAISS